MRGDIKANLASSEESQNTENELPILTMPDGDIKKRKNVVSFGPAELVEPPPELEKDIWEKVETEGDKEDIEESLCRQEYELANIEKINQESVTVFVPTTHVSSWRKVLEDSYGPPILLPIKHGSPPFQFKTDEGVSITSYMRATTFKAGKATKSTILVQGRSSYIKFAQVTLPSLFAKVLFNLSKSVTDNNIDEASKKRKVVQRPVITVDCDECDVVKSNPRELKAHKIIHHTRTVAKTKRQKSSDIVVFENPNSTTFTVQ